MARALVVFAFVWSVESVWRHAMREPAPTMLYGDYDGYPPR